MPSNVQLDAGAGGAIAATKQITHDGDTAQVQMMGIFGLTGSEDSYTATLVNASSDGLHVSVRAIIAGTTATALGKAEDDAHSSGDTGVAVLAVRRDSAAVGSGTDGDYSTLNVNASGQLWTAAVQSGTWTVTGAGGTFPVTDSGGSLTIDNAALSVTGGGVEASALRVTLASDSTGVLSVDDNGASLTVDGTVAATQSGTWNVGTVTTVTNAVTVVGSAAEDAAASGNPVLIGGRYDSSARTLETGDVGAIALNASGQVLVEIAAGAGSGGTAMADGATFTRNTTSLTPAGAVVETAAPSLTNGDVAGLSQTTGGALRVAVSEGGIAGIAEDTASAGGEEGVAILAVRRDAASSGVSTDGDFAFLSVTSDGSLRVSGGGGGTQYAVDTAAGATDTGTLALLVRDDTLATLTPVDGDYTQGRTNARGALWVALDSTAAQTVTLAAGTATNEVVGDAAHDAAIAGNPIRIGARALSADYTAVATGDTADIIASLLGKQVYLPYALPGSTWNYAAASGGITNTTAVTIRAAQGAGIRNYLSAIQVVNGHATTSTEVLIRDGASGTVLHRGWAQAAGGGFACEFNPPLRGTAATLLEVVNVTTGAATYVNAQGFSAGE